MLTFAVTMSLSFDHNYNHPPLVWLELYWFIHDHHNELKKLVTSKILPIYNYTQLLLYQKIKSYQLSKMCSWVSFMMLLLCLSFNDITYARHRKQPHSPATLVGTVYCDTCFRQQAPKSTHFISGS